GTVGRRFRLVLVVLEERHVPAVPLGLELLDRDEAEGRRVDAVAKARRGRPVVEDVPEMRFTMLGADLGPFHEELAILAPLDVLVLERASEARPSGSRVELVERAEERLAGGDVDVDARLLAVPEGVVERRLGGLVLGHLVLLLGERLVELRVAGLAVGLHRLVSGRAGLGTGGRWREEREAPDEHEDSRASVHVSVAWMTVPSPTFPCARRRVNGRGREVRRGCRSRAPGRRGRYVFRSPSCPCEAPVVTRTAGVVCGAAMALLDRFRLTDRVALVTGAGRGIGQAIALAFAEMGAHVVCAARSEAEIEATAARARAFGSGALAVRCDVTDAAQLEDLARRTVSELGRLDILVNNAGGFPPMKFLDTDLPS